MTDNKAQNANSAFVVFGLMMQPQGFRSPQSSLTVDTKAAVNSLTFPTTGT